MLWFHVSLLTCLFSVDWFPVTCFKILRIFCSIWNIFSDDRLSGTFRRFLAYFQAKRTVVWWRDKPTLSFMRGNNKSRFNCHSRARLFHSPCQSPSEIWDCWHFTFWYCKKYERGGKIKFYAFMAVLLSKSMPPIKQKKGRTDGKPAFLEEIPQLEEGLDY